MISGDLPPSSSVTSLRLSAAAAIIRASDDEDAMRIANGSRYGLGVSDPDAIDLVRIGWEDDALI